MQIGAIGAAVERASVGSDLERKLEGLRREERLERDAEVARDVEGLFAQIFVKELRRGLGDGFFGQGAGSDTFDGWLDEELGNSLARDGVLDLAGRVKASLESNRAAEDEEPSAADEVRP